ncbi:retrovirus-related pol polyprotein from transposon TNT 1-94 [Tanacetum coccineum]
MRYLIAKCLSQDVFYTVTDSALTASQFHELSIVYNVAKTRAVELEDENLNLHKKIQNDDHDNMVKHLSRLEVDNLNLQLKYQHLKDRIETSKSRTSKDAPEFDAFFELNEKDAQLQTHRNTIRKLKAQISQLKANKSDVTGTLLPQPLDIKDTLDTLYEIVEEARRKRTSDNSLQYACVYTKTSQELLENVIASCPKTVNKRYRYIATTPVPKKKHVTFADPLETSGNNTPNHVKQQSAPQTNVSTIPSTGVSTSTTTRRSQPKSNTTHDKTFPAKSVPKKKLEEHPRKNKSKLSKTNRVDSSTSVRRTVINTNSNSLCKTCNECLISSNHVKCVEHFLKSYNKSPVKQIWRVKQVKQTWQPTGKIFTTIGHYWKPTGRTLPLGAQCPLTRKTTPKIVPVKIWKPTGRLIPLKGQCPLTRPTALTSDIVLKNLLGTPYSVVVQIVLWYLDSHMTRDRSRLRNFMKKFIRTVRFGNDHFGAIMGYGDYVIGDKRYIEVLCLKGLGHNLFSTVGEILLASDLEVAFRKHTCFVRDLDGVDLIKGNRGTNLYTISVEDMMRSSPICLLSKASKNKSWLWHHHLNHLNFGTLNDLARKELVRSLPRLKFEKDHLCSACQLGKSKKASHKPKMIKTIMEVLHTLHMNLCGPLRVQSINGKKYILVIVDDYSRYVRTDNGTEFIGVVERWNRTLVEAAWTMLIFSKAQFVSLGQERLVAMPVYTQNRSLIHTLHNKTPYELVHDKKPDLLFLRIFGSLCYPTNNSEDLGKLKAKADIGFFVGYAPN